MNPTLVLEFTVIAAVIVAQGFFSGSEMALVSANRARLQADAEEGSRGAALALSMLAREDKLLGTCLIGTNLSLISGATIVSAMVVAAGGPEWSTALVFAPVALLFGEAIPKTVYQTYANSLAPIVAWPIRGAQLAFTPLLWIVSAWTGLLERVVGTQRHPSRAELVMLLDADQGTDIAPEERRIIRRVLELNQTVVEEAMTPLVEVRAVPEDATVAEATRAVLQYGHSRILVFRERVDNIVGLVSHHDLLVDVGPNDAIGAMIRPVIYVPETKRADDLLAQMRDEGHELAVVVDEYGGVVGVVTVEDLLEEVVGDIRDERDTDEPGIRRLSEREWRVPARSEIEEVSTAIGHPLPEGEYDTIAGLILAHTGRIPSTGEIVKAGRLLFLVEQSNERAIQLVRLTIPPDAPK